MEESFFNAQLTVMFISDGRGVGVGRGLTPS